jgi:hypothetical protein
LVATTANARQEPINDLLPRRQVYPPARDYFDALKAGRLKMLKFKNPPRPRRAGGRGGLGTKTVAMIPSHTMAYAPPRKRLASPGAIADRRTHRRALQLLAGCGPEGCGEAVMLANGIDVDTMVEIIVGGLATATPQRTRAGLEVLEVAVVRISDKGRKALATSA